MIELHLVEDGIRYGVVEEFLFTKIYNNCKHNIFRDCNLIKTQNDSLAPCVKYIQENLGKINKSIVIKYQKTDHYSFVKILKIYAGEDLEKYFSLI